MSCIIDDFLFLGGRDDVNPEFIIKNKIKTILNVAVECNYNINDTSIRCIKINLVDAYVDISHYFDHTYSIIKTGLTTGAVLVHCRAGFSRSATIVIAYMMKAFDKSLYDAYTFIMKRRNILPNPHFMKTLMAYEFELFETDSFYKYIDDYIVEYIISSLKICMTNFDLVKKIYYDNNQDVVATAKCVGQLKAGELAELQTK